MATLLIGSPSFFDGATSHAEKVLKLTKYPVLESRSKPHRFWELRRFVSELGYLSQDGLHRILRGHLSNWKAEAKNIGIDSLQDHFRHSFKAGSNLNMATDDCSPEYECTLQYALAIVFNGLCHDHSKKFNKYCENFLSALLTRTVLDKVDLQELVDQDASDETLQECIAPPIAHGRCRHVQEMYQQFDFASYVAPATRFINLIRLVHDWIDECPACKLMYEQLVWNAADLMTDEMTIDTMTSDFNNAEALVLRSASKRRRTDEVIMDGVAEIVAVNKLAVSSSSYCRAHPEILNDPRQALNLDVTYMLGYYASCNMTFASSEVVSVWYDCFRAGFPGKEFLALGAYDCDREWSCWAPLMDCFGGKHTRQHPPPHFATIAFTGKFVNDCQD